MADAEKKDIAKLSFNVQDARQGLLEIGSLLDDLSKKSTTTFDKISKEFKSSFKGAEIIDVKAAQVNMDKVYTMSKQNSERIAVTNNRIAGKIKTIETQKNADIEKLNIQHQNKMEEINSRQLTSAKTIADKITEYAKTYLVYQGFNALKNMAKDVKDEMVNVEYQMVEIDRVLNDSSININNYRDKLIQLAQDYGNSFDNVADITLRLAQAGFNADESLALTEKTLLALNTAELDATQATSDMIAVMAQFGLTTGTTSEIAGNYGDIIDKINKVADNFPTTSEDILNALKKTGSAFNLAGASIDETIATIVAAEKASQRGGKVIGTALSNIVQQLKAEGKINIMESLGLDIYTDSTKTEFKGIMEIFEQLSEKMQSLKKAGKENSVEMQNLLEVFTVFRRNVGASLLGEMAGEDSTYAQVLKTSIDSVGYSIQENEKHMKTAKAAQAQFNAELLKLKTEVWDNGLEDVFRNLLSFGKDIASGINGLIKDIGVLPTAIGAITLALTALNKSTQAGTYIKAIPTIKEINKLLDDTSKGITDVSEYQSNYDNIIKKSDSNFQAYAKSVGKGNISLSSYAGYLVKSTAKTIALTAATIALQAAISAGVSVAITLLVTAIDNWIHADEKAIKKNNELKQQAEDNASKYNEEATAIKELREENEKLAKKEKRTPEENQKIYELQEQINAKIKDTGKQVELITNKTNDQGEVVKTVNDKYQEQLEILKSIEYEKKKQEVKELKEAAELAQENAKKGQTNLTNTLTKGNLQSDLETAFKEAGIITNDLWKSGGEYLQETAKFFGKTASEQKKVINEWLESLNNIPEKSEAVQKSIKNLNKMLEDIKENEDKATEATNKYRDALSELYAMSGYVDTLNSSLQAIANSYNIEGPKKLIAEIQEINQQFSDGKIDIEKYFNLIEEKIKSIDLSKQGEELEAYQAIFAETTRYLAEGISSLNSGLESGTINFADYAMSIKEVADNALELYTLQNNVSFNGENWINNASGQIDEYANSLAYANGRLNEMGDILKVIGDNYEYISEHANEAGEVIFKQADETSAKYQKLASEMTANLNQLAKDTPAAFKSITQSIADEIGISTNEMLSASGYLNEGFLNNYSNMNGALNAVANTTQTATKNVTNSMGNILTKLGEAISKFEYKITGTPFIEGSFNLQTNDMGIPTALSLPSFGFNIKGEGGSSVKELGSALSSFGKDLSTLGELTFAYNKLKQQAPYTPTTTGHYSPPTTTGPGSSKSSETDAAKAAEEAYKKRLEAFKNFVDERERLEKRWVDKQKELGQLSNKDYIYIIQQRIERYKKYLQEVKKATWMNAEDRIELEKKYSEAIEDLQVDYLGYLEDKLNDDIEALKKANEEKIKLIEEEADARIDALKKVENENDRIRTKEEYLKKRQEHLDDISYWEQRTGREAQEALKEAKKNLKELDEEWQQQLEDWSIEDQIKAIESERDAQIKAIQDAQEAQIQAWQDIYNQRVKLFAETGQIIYDNATIQSQKLYETYRKNFVAPLKSDLSKLNNTNTQSTQKKKEYTSYKIKYGDTLSGIASRFNTTISKIMAANPSIKNANKIYSGDTIKIPKFHSGGIFGGIGEEGLALLKKGEVVLNPTWSASLNRMMRYFDNLSTKNQTNITNGPTIEVSGNLVNITASVRNQTDIDNIGKKVEKILKDKFNIKK